MPMADEDFPWDHRIAASPVVVPFRDDEPPAYLDEAPPYAEETEQLDPELPGVVDPGSWAGFFAPHRRFLVEGWIVRGAAGLLSGQEGVGKSLLAQQMATCAAVGRDFLGLPVVQVKSVYVTCEDPLDELWRRQEAINAALGITMADLAGKMLLVSLKGQLGNELGTFDQAGRLTVAARYRQIRKVVTEFGAELTFLDNAAHLFAGNENARHDVAAFLGLLERLAEETDGAVILLAHPNKAHAQGNKQGNEFSGSTGWSAHVRSRLFLDWAAEGDEGVPVDPDARILRKSKANYGKKGEEIDFRWHEWAFTRLVDLPDDRGITLAATIQASAENEIFLTCLDERNRQERPVSESPSSRTYAPKEFAAMAESKRIGRSKLEAAMDRLFRINAIERGFIYRDTGEGKDRFGLRRTSADLSADLPLTGSADVPLTTRRPPPSLTPSTTYIGDALEASPCAYDGEPPAWMDESPPHDPDWLHNPVLNRSWQPDR